VRTERQEKPNSVRNNTASRVVGRESPTIGFVPVLIHYLVPALLLTVAALLLALGDARVLNFVDYKKIKSPRALNRYAAKVTLVFSAASGTISYFAWRYPNNQDILSLGYLPIFLGLLITLAVGAEKFKASSQRHK